MTNGQYEKENPRDPDMPESLYAARLVSVTSKPKHESFLYGTYRRMRDEDPFKFVQRLEMMEKAYMEFRGKKRKEDGAGDDAVLMRVLDDLIAKWENRDGVLPEGSEVEG